MILCSSHMNFIILRTFSITCYNMSNLSRRFLYQFHICLFEELQQLVRKPLRVKLLEGLLNLKKVKSRFKFFTSSVM